MCGINVKAWTGGDFEKLEVLQSRVRCMVLVKRKSKKQKFVVESVQCISVKKMLAHPALVAFRTTPPSFVTSLPAELEREPFKESDRAGHKYTSQFTLTSSDGMVYQGTNNVCQNSSGDICFIGLANKCTGKIKLIEAEEFLVSPKVAHLQAGPASEGAMGDSNPVLLFGVKKNRLRQRLLMEEKERKSGETVGAVEKALPFVDHEKLATTTAVAHADNSYFLPPINDQVKLFFLPSHEPPAVSLYDHLHHPLGYQPSFLGVQARTVDEVYQLSDIVKDQVLEPLIDEANSLLQMTGIDKEKVTPLFMACLAGARLQQEEDNRLRFACAAIFVEYLCRIVSKKGLPRSTMNDTVLQHLINDYKLPKSLSFMSQRMRDKALANLIVISLIVNKYDVPMDTIANSVAVNKPKLLTMVQLLRFKKKGANITLQLPLPADASKDVQRFSVLQKKQWLSAT
ncbi:RNA polymerase I associated factor A49-like [Trinorchestia longiramus]|nr:RNA polymerase I associated factor A49-like [Trinorchestia longiramus]